MKDNKSQLNIKEQIELVEDIFNYPVIKSPIGELLNPTKYGALSYTEYFTFVQTPKKKILVNISSKKYGLIPCSNLFPLFEEKLKQYHKFAKVYKQQDYCKFYVEYIFEDKLIEISNSLEKLKPSIRITHSYNGYLKYNIYFGFYSNLGTNGLYGAKRTASTKLKPTLENLEKIVEEAILQIDNFLNEGIYSLRDEYDVLNQNCPENWEEKVEKISNNINFPKKLTKLVIEKIKENSTQSLIVVTDWIIYTCFNHILNNIENKIFEEKKINMDKLIFLAISNLNKKNN